MIVSINNNQYKIPKNGLLALKNANIVNKDVIVAKVLVFNCGNDMLYNCNNNSKWLVVGKIIGSNIGTKIFCRKFKRRKGYKRTKNYRDKITLIHFTKLVKIINGS
ncbi:bL21 family ribosomal protein [Candidatus Hodgkinia cicadicola]